MTPLEFGWSSLCWVRLPEGQPPAPGWANRAHFNRFHEAVQPVAKPAPGQAQVGTNSGHRYLTPAGTPHNDGVMVRVWEYDVPETSRAEFERKYGAAGDWVQLFSSSDGYRGTELFVSLSDSGRYLTVDRFTDGGAWRAFLTWHGDAYARLDAATKGLTTDECELASGEVG